MGDAVSKGTLIKIPGFGILVKVHLEVSINCVGARFGYRKATLKKITKQRDYQQLICW
jgi:hypothetical protein